jgi:hypothetical protein
MHIPVDIKRLSRAGTTAASAEYRSYPAANAECNLKYDPSHTSSFGPRVGMRASGVNRFTKSSILRAYFGVKGAKSVMHVHFAANI